MSTEKTVADSEIKVFCGDWVMIPVKVTGGQQQFCIVWITEAEPTQFVINASKKLESTRNAIPGLRLECKTEPELGFIAKTVKGWRFDTQAEIQPVLDKIVWEINRLSRS